jgi:hypothetical protein
MASRYREIFGPAGLTDELRAVLWVDSTARGSATLLRTEGRFHARDLEPISAMASPRRGRDSARPPARRREPTGGGRGTTRNRRGDPRRTGLPADGSGRALADSGRAGVDHGRQLDRCCDTGPGPHGRGLRAGLALRDGRILSVHAAILSPSDGTADGAVAVIVDRAGQPRSVPCSSMPTASPDGSGTCWGGSCWAGR